MTHLHMQWVAASIHSYACGGSTFRILLKDTVPAYRGALADDTSLMFTLYCVLCICVSYDG